jgi:RNA polymerase sigma-70 factor (ECF subfamily)
MASVNAGGNTGRPDLSGRDGGAAFTRLYDDHARELHRYLARRLDPATADDLVAETFLVAWERRASYRPDRGSALAWLYGIATNLLRRHARREARNWRMLARTGARADTPADGTDTVAADRADASSQARRLAGALAGLRAEERDVLLLVAWAGLQPVEVAGALDVPVATVRTRLHRARATLRGCLTLQEEHSD